MPDDFEHFDEGVRGKGDQDRLEPIEGGERLRLEHVMEERRIDDRDLKSHGCEYGEDELRVREQTDLPDGLARRSHGEDEEQLEEHDGREGDSPGSDGVGAFLQFEEEHAECADREDRQDDEDQEEDGPREHALPRIARRPVHDVRRVRVHAERESGQTVRHEVDPEELHRREERREPGVSDGEGRDEHDQDLARVRGKEKGDELPDVLIDPRPSSTAATIDAKLSSVRTMSALSLATSVPVIPIATPRLDRFRAGASFTPSPVMATM